MCIKRNLFVKFYGNRTEENSKRWDREFAVWLKAWNSSIFHHMSEISRRADPANKVRGDSEYYRKLQLKSALKKLANNKLK